MGGFKNQCYKAKVVYDFGYGYTAEFNVYYGNQSVTDTDVFVITDKNDKEVYTFYEDSLAEGSHSLIDTLFYLKHRGQRKFNTKSIKLEEIDRKTMENISGL